MNEPGSSEEPTVLPDVDARFQTYLEHVSDVITVIDPNGIIRYVSPSVSRVLGYEPEEQVGEPVFEYLHPEDRHSVMEQFFATITEDHELVEKSVFRFRHADGSWVWLEAIGNNQTDTDIEGFVVISRDITARKRRERELRRYETILEHSADMTIIVDANFKVEYISPAVRSMLGFEPEELYGTNAFEYIHPDDLDAAFASLEQTLTFPEETVTVEFRARRADDGWVWVEVRGRNFLENEYIEGVMVDVRDISERKRQEVELELERDRANALFEELGEPVVEVSFEGTVPIVERMNDTFMATFGLGAEAVGGSLDKEIVPDGKKPHADDINRSVKEGSVTEHEVERETADGLRTFLLRTVPFSVEGDSRAHAIYIDITDRKDYERELERQNERLERVSSVISHDLRNPLTVAKGYLEIAREDHDSDELEYIAEAHDRMDAIIEDTLTLARQGHRAVSLDEVELASIVDRCWSMVDTADATIEVVDDVRFLGDTERLAHLFENLFRNAVEHGGADVSIRVGALDGDGIYIEDDGPGIDPAEREEVFDPGHSTTPNGTGFGLAIVKEIADAHGWDIAITDAAEGGARFELTGLVRGNRSVPADR